MCAANSAANRVAACTCGTHMVGVPWARGRLGPQDGEQGPLLGAEPDQVHNGCARARGRLGTPRRLASTTAGRGAR